jgi:hypothetical protein
MEHDNREALDRYRQGLESEDCEAPAAQLHDQLVESWPQSGERVHGSEPRSNRTTGERFVERP